MAQPVLWQLSFVQLEHAQCVALMCGTYVWHVDAAAEGSCFGGSCHR